MRKTMLFTLALAAALALAPPAHASPLATGVLVDELALTASHDAVEAAPSLGSLAPDLELAAHAPRVLTAGPSLQLPVLAAVSPVLAGFVSMVETAALQEAANPVVWGAVLVLVVLLIARKKKAYADAIVDAAKKAYNATETLKLQGKLGQYEDKARKALAFFNAEMAKKNLTVTDAAVDAAKAIWSDLHNGAIATGTHQPSPSKVAPAAAAPKLA